jgi:hypothetical protein
MYTTIRHELPHTRKAWPGTLVDLYAFSLTRPITVVLYAPGLNTVAFYECSMWTGLHIVRTQAHTFWADVRTLFTVQL